MSLKAVVYGANDAICEYGSMGVISDEIALQHIKAIFDTEFPAAGYICRVSKSLPDGSYEPLCEWVS